MRRATEWSWGGGTAGQGTIDKLIDQNHELTTRVETLHKENLAFKRERIAFLEEAAFYEEQFEAHRRVIDKLNREIDMLHARLSH